MTYVLAVFAFPLLIAVISVGAGLLIERVAGARLPSLLIPPIGFATIVGFTQLTTWTGALAPATPHLVVGLAIGGFVVGARPVVERWRARRTGWWFGWVAGIGAYLVANGPVVMAGRATFPGYLLDTTGSVQLMGAERLITSGHSWDPAGTGGYGLQLAGYFGNGYPSGSHSALGALGALVPVDYLWLYAPYLATLIGFAALVLAWIIWRVGIARWAAAVGGLVSAVPALVYAYTLQGSIKEIAVLPPLMLLGAFMLLAREQWAAGPRAAVPFGVVVAAGLGCIGFAFVPWAGLAALAIAASALVAQRGSLQIRLGELAGRIAVSGVALVVLALPTVATLRTSVRQATGVTTANAAAVADPGNLLRPLLDVQVFGVWLGPSHRVDPGELIRQTYLLIGVVAVAVVLGLIWLVRQRRWAALAWIASSVLVWIILDQRATAWTAAKLLVLLSPVVVLVAIVGAFGRLGTRRIEGLLLGGAVAFGVLYSDAELYHATGLAPTARFDELREIGERFAGVAPTRPDRVTLVPDFDEYALYLLRDMAPDSPGNARRLVPWTFRDGNGVPYGTTVDLDELDHAHLASADAMVVRRSAFKSRPPAAFNKKFEGNYYEVWIRDPSRPATSLHQPRGTGLQPVATERCVGPDADLPRVVARAREAGATSINAALRAPNVLADLSRAEISGSAAIDANASPVMLGFHGPASIRLRVHVRTAGTYRLWVQGTTGRELVARVSGREVGAIRNESGGHRNALRYGTVSLQPGRHTIEFVRGGGSLRPGDADPTVLRGVALAPVGDVRLHTVPLRRWRQLCGRSVDWLEAH